MAEKTWKELRQEKRRFWKAHIRAWGKSGFSQNEYCRRTKLRTNQFTYWKTKLKQKHSGRISFVPVPMNSTHQVEQKPDSNDSGLSVLLGSITISIANNFNPTCLVKVVSTLEERS